MASFDPRRLTTMKATSANLLRPISMLCVLSFASSTTEGRLLPKDTQEVHITVFKMLIRLMIDTCKATKGINRILSLVFAWQCAKC